MITSQFIQAHSHTYEEQDTAAQKPSVCGTRSFGSVSLLYFIYLSRNLSMANTRIHWQYLAFSLNLEARCCINFRMRWHCNCMGARMVLSCNKSFSIRVVRTMCVCAYCVCVSSRSIRLRSYLFWQHTTKNIALSHFNNHFIGNVCVYVLCFVYAQPLMHANCTPNTLLRTRSKSLYEHI